MAKKTIVPNTPKRLSLSPTKKRQITDKIVKFKGKKADIFRMLAQEHNITFEQVKNFYRNRKRSPQKTHGLCRLSETQDKSLVGIIWAFDGYKKPLNRRQTLIIANRIFGIKKRPLTNGWLTKFYLRWQKYLKLQNVQSVSNEKVQKSVYDQVQEWVLEFPKFCSFNGISRDFLVNTDETRLTIKKGAFKTKKLTAKTTTAKLGEDGVYSKAATYIPFITSGSKRLMDVFIFPLIDGKIKFSISNSRRSDRKSIPIFYSFSETGFLQKDHWLPMLKLLKHRLDPPSHFCFSTTSLLITTSIRSNTVMKMA